MKSRFYLFSLIAFCIIFITSCSPVYVSYVDQDPSANFLKYNTFQFQDFDIVNKTALEPHQENIEKIKNAIRKELAARGVKEGDNPNMKVNLGILMEEGVTTRETTIQDAAYMGQRNYHWESEEIVVDRYEEGSVIVDIIDAKKRELVWQGAVKSVITQKQDKMEKRINEGIANLFKKYPISPKAM